MKIAIDISQVVYGTGVSVYTENLVRSLLAIDDENQYLLYGGSLRKKSKLVEFTENLTGNFDCKLYNFPPTLTDIMWNRLHIINLEQIIGQFDVVHTSDWAEPPSKIPKVTTIHDLAPINYPGETHPKVVSAHKKRLKLVKAESAHIIVPSLSVKKELIDYGFHSSKIAVIPESQNPNIKKVTNTEITRVKNKFNIVGDYIVGWGTSKRKNYERSFEAFKKVKTHLNLSTFVLLGVASHNTSDNMIATGYVSDADVSALYSGASALAYPSITEGFGIPILDAFACDCPVVTSRESSMPEVAGNAAILVDPFSIKSIADGLVSAVKQRNKLMQKSHSQLKKFSWEKTARETLKVYKLAAN